MNKNNHYVPFHEHILSTLQIIFITLKVFNLINLRWIHVFIPTFVALIIYGGTLIIYGVAILSGIKRGFKDD